MYVKWDWKHLNTCSLAWLRIKSTFLQTWRACVFQDCMASGSLRRFIWKQRGWLWERASVLGNRSYGDIFYLERVRLTFLHSWSREFKLDLVGCQVVKLCCVVAYIMELSLWTTTWSLGRSTNFSKAIAEKLNSFIFTMHVLRITVKGICCPQNTHEVCCKQDCFLQIHATVNS